MKPTDLDDRISDIARLLFGIPNDVLSSRDQLRFGSNGSIAVEVGGAKAGTYYNHEAKRGGGPMQMLAFEAGLITSRAAEWLRSNLGIEIEQEPHGKRVTDRIVTAYDYRDQGGVLVYQVVRLADPKDFRQRAPNGTGGWTWRVKGIRQVPYRLPELIASPRDAVIYTPEGEKDADILGGLGLVTTTNAGGAGKWRHDFAQYFAGRDVVILPDNDAAGQAHAKQVAENLAPVAARVRIVELPGLSEKGDVSDWIEAGGTKEQLEALTEAAPIFESRSAAVPGKASGSAQQQTLTIGSDVEIAKRIAEDLNNESGEPVFDDGSIYRYDGERWVATTHVDERRAVHPYDGATYFTPEFKHLAVRLSKSRIDSILNELRVILAQSGFFKGAPTGINCQSGFITFDDAGAPNLVPHDRAHGRRHILPGRWFPGMASEPPSGSMLHKLIYGVFEGDADADKKRDLVAEMLGGTALGYVTQLAHPKTVILYGLTADNGKSQILDLHRGIVPEDAITSIPPTKFSDPTYLVKLAGKLLNAADELKGGSASIASEIFKACVTGNVVTARDLYRSKIDFRPIAFHLFATQGLPNFEGGFDRGVLRRLLVLVFTRVIPMEGRIIDIGQRIAREEPDLLLAFAVGGATRLIKQRNLTVPPSSEVALREWAATADPVLAWVTARVQKADHPVKGEGLIGRGIKSAHAHKEFKDWAIAEGYRQEQIPAIGSFLQRLQGNKIVSGIKLRHANSGNWLTGLTVDVIDSDSRRDVAE